MIDRRGFVAGSIAWGAAAPLLARPAARRGAVDLDAGMLEGFTGAVLHARSGRVLGERYIGLADTARTLPVTAATRFAFGSGTKLFASVAVLRLVEAGRLALDAPLTEAYPDFRRDTGARVTLRHLLSNTSGIPDLLARAAQDDPSLRTSSDSAAAMVARFGGGDLAFAPGSAFDYAAINWVIVRAIVERVTRQSFEAAMHALVFRPLGVPGLRHASDGWTALPNMAQAYATDRTSLKMTPVPAFVAASGNLTGTARDAMQAMHGIFATRFLTAVSRAALTTVRWPEQEYALGGRVHPVAGARWAWETGKVQGYRALLAQNLKRDETIVVFNATDLAQGPIAGWVERIAR